MELAVEEDEPADDDFEEDEPEETGWEYAVYLWNAEGTDAVLADPARPKPVPVLAGSHCQRQLHPVRLNGGSQNRLPDV